MHGIDKLLVVLCLALAAVSGACSPGPSTRSPEEVAAGALPTLAQVVDETNYQALGFESPDEAARVTVGVPYPVQVVDLDALAAFRPGDDANALPRRSPITLVPLLVDGQARCAVTVIREESGELRFGGFGQAPLIQALEEHRRASMKATGLPATTYFEVRVPALELHFLGYREGATLILIQPYYTPRLGDGGIGKPLPAATVFGALVPMTEGDFSKPR